jgi:hypothetical protein
MDALELSGRTATLMEDCLRVDQIGVELGVTDPDDPLYRAGQELLSPDAAGSTHGRAALGPERRCTSSDRLRSGTARTLSASRAAPRAARAQGYGRTALGLARLS